MCVCVCDEGVVTIAGNDPLLQVSRLQIVSRQPAEALTGQHRGRFKVMLISIMLAEVK